MTDLIRISHDRLINLEAITCASWGNNGINIFFSDPQQALILYDEEAKQLWEYLQTRSRDLSELVSDDRSV